MSAEIIHIEHDGVVLKCKGVIEARDIDEIHAILHGESNETKNINYKIYDLTEVCGVDFSYEDIQRFSIKDKMLEKNNNNILIAIVGKNITSVSLARMLHPYTYGLSINLKIFNKIVDAEKWVFLRRNV